MDIFKILSEIGCKKLKNFPFVYSFLFKKSPETKIVVKLKSISDAI